MFLEQQELVYTRMNHIEYDRIEYDILSKYLYVTLHDYQTCSYLFHQDKHKAHTIVG